MESLPKLAAFGMNGDPAPGRRHQTSLPFRPSHHQPDDQGNRLTSGCHTNTRNINPWKRIPECLEDHSPPAGAKGTGKIAQDSRGVRLVRQLRGKHCRNVVICFARIQTGVICQKSNCKRAPRLDIHSLLDLSASCHVFDANHLNTSMF